MFTTLLSPLAVRQRLRRLLGPVAGLALVLAATPLVEAQTVYGLGTVSGATSPTGLPLGTQLIGSLDVATGTINIIATQVITGVAAGQSLVGMDSRPATGQLFALGYNAGAASDNAQLYILNPATGEATAVGNVFSLALGGAGERIGFDFNPTVDRIRVVGSYNPATGQTNNYRLNPTPGAGGAIGVTPDLPLNYAGGTPADPGVGAAAYTNSTLGATGTVLYDVDEINGLLARQNPPNDGVLGGGTPAVAPVPITFNGDPFGVKPAIDIDIYLNPSNSQNQAYLIEVTPGGSSNFYTLNLTTGAATSVGAANVVPAFAQVQVRDIAVAIDRTVPALTGQLAYAVTTNNNILGFDVANPSVVRTLAAITGIAAGQTLVGTDYRPNTGQLFGLGYNPAAGPNDRLYTIDPVTGVATAVGGADIDLDLGADVNVIGLDFNPTVDRIRVVSANDRNYRLNPNTGGIAFTDLDLKYTAAGPAVPNSSQSPTAGTAAYINSFVGATATGLYVLDHALGYVSLQNPPNDGVLTTSRLLTGVNPTSGALDALNDFDVFYDGTANVPYLAAVPTGQAVSRFYRLNAFSPTLTTDQVATDLGTIGLASAVRDISVTLATGSTVAATPPALTGRLLYGLAAGNLISFDSGNPNVIRTAVNITGLPADGSQVLVGSDFRPATGVLYALGYNATAGQGQLYTLDLTSGALTAVGGLNAYALGAAAGIGFDFNPVPDRIRIIGSNGNNYRTNPNDGTVTTDGVTSAALVAAAYTNNDNNTATATVLYGYDQTTNQVVSFSNPNAGTNAPVGGSGITVNPANGVEFDIYADVTTPATPVNSAFAAAAPTGTTADFLYDVSLTSGAFNSLGRIGTSSNLSGLAAFFTPAPVLPVGFTWTGAVSTDWGTAGNWSTNTVPTAADNVVIPDVANDPVVSNAQQANGVTLNSGTTLTLADAGVLSVSGNFTNNSATVTFSGVGTGRVALTGTAAQTIGGTLTTFPNLTVGTASASIGGPVAIRRGLVLTGSLTTTGQTLTLLSDASGTAYVVNSGGTVNGSATVQRYIDPALNGGPGYRHYSAPVASSTVGDLANGGYTPVVNGAYNTSATPGAVTPFPNIFGYDEARVNTSGSPAAQDFDKGFFSPGALTDALEVTRGYTVNIAGSALVDFVGPLNSGTLRATGLTRGAQTESGYHLRGNPFPSPLDWNLMVSNGRLTGVDNALYVFKSSGQYTGSYASYVNGVGTNGGTNVVPLAQGFFVRTSTPGTAGALAFTDAERVTTFDATPFQRGTADTRPQLTLTLASATARAQAAVYFEQGATAGFDRAFDARQLLGSNGLTLASEAGAEVLAVNGQPVLTGADVLVPLRVAALAAGSYTLAVANLANLPANYYAYLRDALTGTYTDLAATPSTTLTLAANGATGGRYAVLFTTQARVLATAPAALARLASVYPNPARGAATLLLPAALRSNQPTGVTVVDNLGRVVLTRTLAAGATETLELPLGTLAPGVYSVQARTAAGLVVKRLVVE
ncbi:DUF4394 domain-containing protein [Hymenobacter sp.]|uniref:DUF4394 domain-containing protein n=1 Tax=Hymenobacter sp. TaxID=1898978 RepID=UPI00286B535E|nr:DUF4394 domain-containing protein [Hymenobacter sp.]